MNKIIALAFLCLIIGLLLKLSPVGRFFARQVTLSSNCAGCQFGYYCAVPFVLWKTAEVREVRSLKARQQSRLLTWPNRLGPTNQA